MDSDRSSNQRQVIQASEILDKIERGEDVEYDSVIIEGDLDVSGLDLPTEHVDRTEHEKWHGLPEELEVISSHITITNSEIWGNVNFSNVHFKEPIYFSETKFGGYANFKGAEFTGGDAYFTGAEFGGYANFGGAKFTGGDAGFKNAKFTSGNANFARAKFAGGDVYFMEAKFTGGNANFMDVKFTGGDVNFSGTKFIGGYAYFMGVKFTGGDANFVGAKFYKELKLDDFKFDRLYIDWNSIKDKLVFNGPVYLPLIKNFRIIERFCDADDCYYAYRKASQAQKHWYSEENWLIEHIVLCCIWISANIKRISEYFSWINNYPPFTWIHRFNWSKLLDWIGFVSCGYGVRIQPIILWVLGSVLSFTLLYKFLPERYGGITESGPSTVTMEALSNSTLLFTFSSGDGAVSPSWGECLYFSFTALTGGPPTGCIRWGSASTL